MVRRGAGGWGGGAGRWTPSLRRETLHRRACKSTKRTTFDRLVSSEVNKHTNSKPRQGIFLFLFRKGPSAPCSSPEFSADVLTTSQLFTAPPPPPLPRPLPPRLPHGNTDDIDWGQWQSFTVSDAPPARGPASSLTRCLFHGPCWEMFAMVSVQIWVTRFHPLRSNR